MPSEATPLKSRESFGARLRRVRSVCGSARSRTIAWSFRQLLLLRLALVRLAVGKPLLVFVRFGAIGDIVCTFPAVTALIRQNPKLHFVYVTLSEFGSIPKLGGFNGTVVTTRIHCRMPSLPSWIAAKTFEPRYNDERAEWGEPQHLVDEFATACGVSLEPTEATGPFLKVAAEHSATARTRISRVAGSKQKVIAIHAGPTWPVREWSSEHWAALVALLKQRLDCRVLQLGVSRHVELGKRALAAVPGAEPLIGHLKLEELVAILGEVDLLIGVDSGLLHLAGAVKTPSVGIFGPIDPKFRLPRQAPSAGVSVQLPCSYCHHRRPRLHWVTGCPYDIECMGTITSERVFEKCQELLLSNSTDTEPC